jgi:hypothetical protein
MGPVAQPEKWLILEGTRDSTLLGDATVQDQRGETRRSRDLAGGIARTRGPGDRPLARDLVQDVPSKTDGKAVERDRA